MRYPAKWELKEYLKLADMVDFLKEKYRPFTQIAREAINRGIITEDKTNRLYQCFSVCVSVVGSFDAHFVPSDQSPTGRDRYEWKLKNNVTKESFLKGINDYIRANFKTS